MSREFADQHPEVPWRDLCGMRDRVIHQYHRVNLNLVWEVTETDIPELLRKLEPLLPRKET